MEGVAVPYTSLLPGVSSAPVVLAWAILWSLSETIWPAKLAKNKPRKNRIQAGLYISRSSKWQSNTGTFGS